MLAAEADVVDDFSGSITCMHCRFFQKSLANCMTPGSFDSDKISQKLQRSFGLRKYGVVILGSDVPTSAIKLSVRSLSEKGVFAGCSVVCV